MSSESPQNMSDFSAIISSVKPRQRTALYKILAAFYSLRAATVPVTVGQVRKVLRLHFGSKIPSNLSARFRDSSKYIRVIEGPPLKWCLTDKGLEKLRQLSGLALDIDVQQYEFKTDIGIVCALEDPEFSAVINALGGRSKWREIGDPRYTHVYRETEMLADNGDKLRVVGVTSTSMGLTAAAIVTTQMILQFRPRIVLMIGIAAGTRDGNKQFGDVLVADPSVDYNSGKVVQNDGVRDFQPDPYPIGLNPRLRSVLQKYRGASAIFDFIRSEWKGPLPVGANRLHVGPLGAADQVIDDASRMLEIQKNWRKLIGVEMETYGVYRACHESPDPKPRFISFKAVCDFAAEKSDSWQSYAAYVAAEFGLRFLRSEWSALWPNK
jgi:nucleoside phosphorylase